MLSSHCSTNLQIQDAQFSTLDVSSLNIKIIDKIRPCFCFISELYLDNNLLMTLNGIQQFQNLEVFSFNFNHVQLYKQLQKISNKFFIKKISFMGNPLQWDVRTKYQNLVVHLFPNLQILNPAQENRIKLRFKTFQERVRQMRKKKQAYLYDEQVDDEQQIGKTSRFQPKLSRNQSQYTRRVAFKAQNKYYDSPLRAQPINDTHIKIIATKNNSQFKHKNKQRSTTANQSNNQSDQTNRPHRNQQNQNKQIKSSHKKIQIKPFEQVQEPQQQPYQQQQNQLQNQSSIRNEENSQQEIQISQGTGHFSSSIGKSKSFVRNKQNNPYKSLAMEFLQAQKNEIAEAFRIRHLKQVVFTTWFCYIQQKNSQQQQLKRKAWGAIRMAKTLNKLVSK